MPDPHEQCAPQTSGSGALGTSPLMCPADSPPRLRRVGRSSRSARPIGSGIRSPGSDVPVCGRSNVHLTARTTHRWPPSSRVGSRRADASPPRLHARVPEPCQCLDGEAAVARQRPGFQVQNPGRRSSLPAGRSTPVIAFSRSINSRRRARSSKGGRSFRYWNTMSNLPDGYIAACQMECSEASSMRKHEVSSEVPYWRRPPSFTHASSTAMTPCTVASSWSCARIVTQMCRVLQRHNANQTADPAGAKPGSRRPQTRRSANAQVLRSSWSVWIVGVASRCGRIGRPPGGGP